MFHGQTLVKLTPKKLYFRVEKNIHESTMGISNYSLKCSVKRLRLSFMLYIKRVTMPQIS